ncbi:MAG: TorF family putative porin, partial [Pirellulaceae bacterium]
DINFGSNPDGTTYGQFETDFYAGIKPVWGPVTFDLGVIYYAYPGGKDGGPAINQFRELDYVEGKVGASVSLIPKLTTGVTVFYSPQYTGGQGEVVTVEGVAAYEFPAFFKIVPTLSGTLGGVFGDAGSINDPFITANGKDSYMYWNAGMTFGLDKLSIDFRYWDTNIPDGGAIAATGFCSAKLLGCDERFVATAKVTF